MLVSDLGVTGLTRIISLTFLPATDEIGEEVENVADVETLARFAGGMVAPSSVRIFFTREFAASGKMTLPLDLDPLMSGTGYSALTA